MSEGFVEVGRCAYRNCQINPVMHVGLMLTDITRMPSDKDTCPFVYMEQLLGGFMSAALEVGDNETVDYIDRVCPTARKILKASF